MELGRITRLATGVACLGAAAIHLVAASAHAHHPHMAAFFGLLAAVQAMFGVAALSSGIFPAAAVVVVNGAAVAIWLLSRTLGVPLVPGAEAIEAAGFADTVCTLLELSAITGAGMARRVAGLAFPLPLRVPGARSAGALALVVVAVTSGGAMADLAGGRHGHSHEVDTAAAPGAPTAGSHDDGEHRHRSSAATVVAQGAHAVHTSAAAGSAGAHPHTSSGAADHDSSHQTPTSAPAASRALPSPSGTPGHPATVRYGPFVLPPAGLEAAELSLILTSVKKPCEDCYLTTIRPDLVYADGSRANYDTGPMLHHAVWYQIGTPDATCDRVRGERFFASGNERTPIVFPNGFGVPVTANRWDMAVEIMNHAPAGQTVYVQLDVVHRPASDPDTLPLRPVWLDIANCGNSRYAVPAGPHRASWRWASTVTGRVIAAGGHVHDGGVKTVLNNATTAASMCTSWATYGRDPSYQGSVDSMSTCAWDRLGTVRGGELLEIESYYDGAEPQTDVMGIMLAYIYPTSDLSGGSEPPPSEPPPGSGSSPPPPRHDH
jgi:hypothetical protein